MKPTVISSNQQSSRRDDQLTRRGRIVLQTDYNFQPVTRQGGNASSLKVTSRLSELRSFRGISRDFLNTETSRNYLTEVLLFALITAVAAWPIKSMLTALAQAIR